MKLSDRIAAAQEPDHALFAEAHLAIFPEPIGEQAPIQTDNWRAWSNRRYKFGQLLRHGAYVDAALTLVPEGWNRSFTDDPDDLGGCIAELWTAKQHAWANAATPALAMTAAALKARGL